MHPLPRQAHYNRILIWLAAFIIAAGLSGCALPATQPVFRVPSATAILESSTPAVITPTDLPFAGTFVIPATLLTPPPTLTPLPGAPSATPSPSPLPPSPTPAPTDTPLPSPTPKPDTPVRFAVIGDFGLSGQTEEDVANLVKSWNPSFIITTGDNNYPSGGSDTIDENIGQYYSDYLYPYDGFHGEGAAYNRFFPTLGNHDYLTYNAEPYLNYFELPGNERYYDYTWGPLHMFAINSDEHEPDGVGLSSAQAAWLRDRLAASTAPWKIVYFHHAPYSSGLHGGTAWMRWPFTEWGASAVIAGHDHSYERLEIEGIPYIVNGLGGGPRYDIASVVPGSLVQFDSDWGAMLVTANSTTITFQFITRQSIIVDTLTLDLTD